MPKTRIAQFRTYSRERAIKYVQRGSIQAANELKRILGPEGGARTGTVYLKGKNGNIRHQASAPGEAPASDSGRLRQSAAPETVRVAGTKVTGGAGVSTPYARRLELGDEHVKPRPFISRLNQAPHKDRIKTAAEGAFK